MEVIDRKFQILAVNPVNGKRYTEADSLLLCAKDAAVPAALFAYRDKCVELSANPEHIESINLLVNRVITFQTMQGGGRTPDTIGAEIPRCLNWERGVEGEPRRLPGASLAAAVRDLRGEIERLIDDCIEPGSAAYDNLKDAKDLLGVLAHIVLGSTVSQAFGSPGDWGYGTKIGRALAARG